MRVENSGLGGKDIMDLNELDKKAKPGAFSTFDMEVFVPEVEKLEAGDIYLEIGVDRGKSLSVAKMVAKKGVEIHGVDIQNDPEVPGTYFHKINSWDLAVTWDKKIKLLFIDGDHSFWGCHKDIELWSPHMASGGVILFHDCDESSPGVVQAVAEFIDTNKGTIQSWQMFKRVDKNTSMSKVQL